MTNLSTEVFTYQLIITNNGTEEIKSITEKQAKFFALQLKKDSPTITLEFSNPLRIFTVFKDKVQIKELTEKQKDINSYINSLQLNDKTFKELQEDLKIRKIKKLKVNNTIIDNMVRFIANGRQEEDNFSLTLQEIKQIFKKKGRALNLEFKK